MGKSVIINRKRHVSVLADHRLDPVTKQLLKVGDEVCVCSKCKTIYLKDVWVNLKNGKCCHQSSTLSDIPNLEYGTNPQPVLTSKSFKNSFVFFLLCTVILGSLSVYWYYTYEKEHAKKNRLQYIIKTKYIGFQDRIDEINKKVDEINSDKKDLKYQLQKEKLTTKRLNNSLYEVEFNIGKKQGDFRGLSYDNNPAGYVSGYKMYFDVKMPIVIKQLSIFPERSGYITLQLFNSNDELVNDLKNHQVVALLDDSTFDPKPNIIPSLNFKIEEKGRYYLTVKEDVDLWYDAVEGNYDYCKNGIVEIIGCSSEGYFYDKDYYAYFYDIKYSLNISID
ncbi:hypothetical protein [uncultured Psychroserpens sp.]|uniref:hypothetical protein n=1 Tax=uncultured Psychroserpens sp. TaxID=255436 RepID=UPI002630A36D|nr:hypothetical protein [uncultured Psychroserpens sp.]